MRSIKVLATNSTNVLLREKLQENPDLQNCSIRAVEQTAGKGQRGASWESEPGKNLTCSLLLTNLAIPVQQQFKLSAIVAMALYKVLKQFDIPGLQLKWPNDILTDGKKVAGILIENRLEGNNIKNSIIGLGLNLNQDKFESTAKATSLKKVTGKNYAVDLLWKTIINQIEKDVYRFKELGIEEVLNTYKKMLFKFEVPCAFELASGERKTGIIKNVSKQGKLIILFEDDALQSFAIKEVKMLY